MTITTIPPQFGGSIPCYDVNQNDVLCGRGTAHCNHPGNRRFHFLAKKFRDDYATAQSKEEKTAISRSIVKAIRMENGRFLRKKQGESSADGSWQELGDKKAWEKTCQLLRETIIKHSNKKKMEKSRQERKQVHRSVREVSPFQCTQTTMNHQGSNIVTPPSPHMYQEQTAAPAPVPIPVVADDIPRFQDQVQWSRNEASRPVLSRHQAALSAQDFDSRIGQQLHTPPRSPYYDFDNYYYQNDLYRDSSYRAYPQSTSDMPVNDRSPSSQSIYQDVSSNFKYMMQSMNESERIMAQMGIVPGDSVSRYQV